MFAKITTNQVVKVIDLNNETITCTRHTLTLKKSTILKITDTIEELCDEFVVIGMKENHIERSIYNEFDKELFTNLKCKVNGFDVYGAIWTDKGLIYVAKLNDKGELELL